MVFTEDSFVNIVNEIKAQEHEKLDTLNKLVLKLKEVSLEVQQVVIRNEERQKITKERFNVFDSITKHHKEELHSRFLHYLLDPTGHHDCGSLFLRLFIETIAENPLAKNQLVSLIDSDYIGANVIREMFIGYSYNTDNYGRIDLFIDLPKINIAIENKIYAGEQVNQIKRYVGYCRQLNKPYLTFYLTLDGKESVESSDQYVSISYENHIIDWLDRCIKETSQYPNIHVGINYYKQFLEKYVLNKPSNLVIMNVKEILLKDNNSTLINYSTEIKEALEEIDFGLRADFFNKLIEKLRRKHSLICLAERKKIIPAAGIWDCDYGGVLITSPSLILKMGRKGKVYFYIEHNGTNIYYGLFGLKDCIGKNAFNEIDLSSLPISDSINNLIGQKSIINLESPDDGWIAWRFFKVAPDTDFNSSRINYSLHTQLEQHVERLVLEIENYLKLWEETIQVLDVKE